MKKLLILLLLLSTSIGVFAQLIPGVVASSRRPIKEESGEPGEPPEFLMTDGYTFAWLVANTDHLTLSGSRIMLAEDIGPNGNDFEGDWGASNVTWDATEGAMQFNGGNSHLICETGVNGLANIMFIVFKLTSNGNLCALDNNKVIEINNDGLWLQADDWVNTDGDYSSNYAILTYYLSENLAFIELNADDRDTDSYANFTGTGGAYIGYPISAFSGYVKEVIIRSTNDSQSNIDDINYYLMSKYGIE